MFKMFAQAFSALTVFFQALELNAKAILHLSTWAEQSAAAFADEAQSLREQKLNALNRQLEASKTKDTLTLPSPSAT